MQKTLLLIDDCDMMRRFLMPVFQENYTVVAVKNAAEAILWLTDNTAPDAVLLDYNLPDMSGLEFLQHFRLRSNWTNVPVIMLSGVSDAEKRWQCLEAGADDFLSKPFHPRELALRVNKFVPISDSPKAVAAEPSYSLS
ncbi:MAG: response regulator [Saprospiraceae bacterium]|nr:response regulator [Saprospiraceae bacterium]